MERIEIVVDRRGFRRWHVLLGQSLRRRFPGATVAISAIDGVNSFSLPVQLLLALERMLLHRARDALCDLLDERDLGPKLDCCPDVIIDCSGLEDPMRPHRSALLLRPLYDSSPFEAAAVAALLAGACPLIAVEDIGQATVLATGLPSSETGNSLTASLEAVASCVILLIGKAVSSRGQGNLQTTKSIAPLQTGRVASFFLSNALHYCVNQIYRLCCYPTHWRIGWRFIDGPGVLETGTLAGARWNVLPSKGSGFAADPFPVGWNGRHFIFFEHFDYRYGKGTIFAQEFSTSGLLGEPFQILEEPWHLSYPFVFKHEGHLFMLPEASSSRRVSLYRCVDFPAKWELDIPLLT